MRSCTIFMRFMRPHPLTDYKAKAMPHGSCPVQPVFFPLFRHFLQAFIRFPNTQTAKMYEERTTGTGFSVLFLIFSRFFSAIGLWYGNCY